MRSTLQGVGALLTAMGISGTIDHLWTQPILGVVLNSFDRLVVDHVPGLRENAILANLGLAACGVVLILVVEGLSRTRSGT
ncbi:hypothetical protein [Nocardiopsis sp. MG754419]|uniref:hypothetical protein n=1 Tax=Nocardiopsis sp. MG754419 TaxID=2259865 RepID=UPI001BA7CB7E|nr:hypothetical protein [Nocardiopsis sp. MG754419]MBR8744338.1 hypothetical protein [Nocardiopsis sp. MG754419]